MGIFTEAVKGYAHFGAPVADIKAVGFNLLGDHWSPVNALLAPVWWAWPSPMALYTVQAMLFGWSVWIVGETAARLLDRPAWGTAVALAYGLSFGLQEAADTGYHEIAWAVPLLAMVMRQLLWDRPVAAVAWSLPLLLVKEELGLTVAALGVLVAVRHAVRRQGRARVRLRLLGGTAAVVGLGSVALDTLVLIPRFNPHHRYDYFATEHGGGITHLAIGATLLALVWPMVKWTTLGWTFGSTGFLCLRSPLLLLAAPNLLIRFTSAYLDYSNTGYHYSAQVMPIVFLAGVDGLQRMLRSRWAWQRTYGRNAPGVLVALAVATTVSLPLGMCDLVNPGTYDGGPHATALRAADALVPAGTTVWAGNSDLATLAAKDRVIWISDTHVRPEWIVVDRPDFDPGKDLPGWASGSFPGTAWTVRFDRSGVVVLQLTGAPRA